MSVNPGGAGVKLKVRRLQQQQLDNAASSLTADPQWLAVSSVWLDLNLDYVEGWSSVQKLEYVLASLSE